MKTPQPASPVLRELLDAQAPKPGTEVTLQLAQEVTITVRIGTRPPVKRHPRAPKNPA